MTSTRDAELAVIGAGVIGLACTERLRAEGHDVLVLDAGRIGDGATGAALGALMPHAPTGATPLADAQMASLGVLPDWIAGIEARSGLATGYRPVGRIEILPSAKAAAQADAKIAAARDRWAALSDRDRPLRRIDQGEARAAVPRIADAPHGYLTDDVTAQVDPPALLHGLATASRARGARILAHTPVHTLRGDDDGVTLETAARTIRVDHVVVASGAGDRDGALRGAVPIQGVKGEAMLLPDFADTAPRPIVSGPGGFALTRSDGLAVGSTSDRTAPPDATVTREGRKALMGRARKLLAIAPDTARQHVWSGVRPAAPDGQPVIGPHPRQPRVLLALGHFKTGLSMAPGTAEAVAAHLAGRPVEWPWTAFGAERFAG